ncbi:MAG TPA: TRAP transporter small permease [Kofleriaceae bacterium]|nr:TRAP transporter small permease [Kofleriaceae bacterium]
MTPPAGGDGSKGDAADDDAADAVPAEADMPPTRRQTAPTDPAGLATHPADPAQFPDDGPLSSWLRRADRALGNAEQAVLFVLLGAVVLTAAAAALSDRVIGHHMGRWWFDIVRGGTFSVAMIGAVFATHQQRHLSMDLVSRRLPARGRLILRVILALFTVLSAAQLVRSGLHQLDTVGEESGEHLVSTHTIVTFMPIGAILIIVHTVLHMVIDIDYLARGKLPPERARSGH